MKMENFLGKIEMLIRIKNNETNFDFNYEWNNYFHMKALRTKSLTTLLNKSSTLQSKPKA